MVRIPFDVMYYLVDRRIAILIFQGLIWKLLHKFISLWCQGHWRIFQSRRSGKLHLSQTLILSLQLHKELKLVALCFVSVMLIFFLTKLLHLSIILIYFIFSQSFRKQAPHHNIYLVLLLLDIKLLQLFHLRLALLFLFFLISKLYLKLAWRLNFSLTSSQKQLIPRLILH